MSGSLTHSPATIIRSLLIDKGHGVLPPSTPWPIYVGIEPDTPDSVITLYDTTSRLQGRFMVNGETQEHYGFQVRVRDPDHPSGWTKANSIAVAMDEDVANDGVTVGSSTYTVYAITRVSGVLSIGKMTPTSKLNIFTVNAVVALRQIS